MIDLLIAFFKSMPLWMLIGWAAVTFLAILITASLSMGLMDDREYRKWRRDE